MKNDTEKSPALVDTNMLVHAYAENSTKGQKAAEMINDCFQGKTTLAVSLQNIGEFCDVGLRKFKLDPAIVQRVSMHILACVTFIKVAYTGTTLHRAVELSAASKLKFWDAVLVATMKENAIETIYTEDAAFGKIEGIKAVNPFQ